MLSVLLSTALSLPIFHPSADSYPYSCAINTHETSTALVYTLQTRFDAGSFNNGKAFTIDECADRCLSTGGLGDQMRRAGLMNSGGYCVCGAYCPTGVRELPMSSCASNVKDQSTYNFGGSTMLTKELGNGTFMGCYKSDYGVQFGRPVTSVAACINFQANAGLMSAQRYAMVGKVCTSAFGTTEAPQGFTKVSNNLCTGNCGGYACGGSDQIYFMAYKLRVESNSQVQWYNYDDIVISEQTKSPTRQPITTPAPTKQPNTTPSGPAPPKSCPPGLGRWVSKCMTCRQLRATLAGMGQRNGNRPALLAVIRNTC